MGAGAIVAIVVVVLLLLVLGGGLLLRSLSGAISGGFGSAGSGSEERLAELRAGCEAGDWQACDDLFWEAPAGSSDEQFGDTCGGRNEPTTWCVDLYGP